MRRCLALLISLYLSSSIQAQNYNLALLGHLDLGTKLSGLWGYVDKTGKEYALVGRTNGSISVVNIDQNPPVEVFTSPGKYSTWREVKVYNHHAYVVTEAPLGGVQIIDLSSLPEDTSLHVTLYTDSNRISTAHTLWIDEEGLLYLWGSNRVINKKGYAVYDLKPDPQNPRYLYTIVTPQIHDGIVFGNRMYLSHIDDGFFSIYDVSDKTRPLLLGTQYTPQSYTHNTWPTDDGKYLLATDERLNSYLTMYDISDPGNIRETDRIQTHPGSGACVHNVHVVGDFAVSSYYTEGVTIHDISDPANIIEVGKYDTSPREEGSFNGSWEVYPYFPSGKVITGDTETGLYVLYPIYRRAARLHGQVTNAATGKPLPGVQVMLNGWNISETTSSEGIFKTGTGKPGYHSITFSKTGFETLILNDIYLQREEVQTLFVALSPLGVGESTLEGDAYPFVDGDRLRITLRNDEALTIQVVDLVGRTERSFDIKGKGDHEISAFHDLPPGIYLVRLLDVLGRSQVHRILKP